MSRTSPADWKRSTKPSAKARAADWNRRMFGRTIANPPHCPAAGPWNITAFQAGCEKLYSGTFPGPAETWGRRDPFNAGISSAGGAADLQWSGAFEKDAANLL